MYTCRVNLLALITFTVQRMDIYSSLERQIVMDGMLIALIYPGAGPETLLILERSRLDRCIQLYIMPISRKNYSSVSIGIASSFCLSSVCWFSP